MKRALLLLLLPIALLAACAARGDAPGLVRTLELEADETYVEFHPADGYVMVREYSLRSSRTGEPARREHAAQVAALVQAADYCEARYGMPGFEALEERAYHDRGMVAVECHLLTRERRLQPMMEAVYGRVLNRPVEVANAPGEVGLHFTGDDVRISSGNTMGTFGKEDRRALFWRNGERRYEIVFGWAEPLASTSIVDVFGPDVASPEKSAEEIEAWKAGR